MRRLSIFLDPSLGVLIRSPKWRLVLEPRPLRPISVLHRAFMKGSNLCAQAHRTSIRHSVAWTLEAQLRLVVRNPLLQDWRLLRKRSAIEVAGVCGHSAFVTVRPKVNNYDREISPAGSYEDDDGNEIKD